MGRAVAPQQATCTTSEEEHFPGPRWDREAGTIAESLPKELYPPMPVMHIKGVTTDEQARTMVNDWLQACGLRSHPIELPRDERPTVRTCLTDHACSSDRLQAYRRSETQGSAERFELTVLGSAQGRL